MVVGDLYPFHHHQHTSMNTSTTHDDGPQSSEEGSGMHSPVLYGAGASSAGDSFRYNQHDHHHHSGPAPPPPPPHPHSHSHSHSHAHSPTTSSGYHPHPHPHHHQYSLAAPGHAQIVLERHHSAASHGGGGGGHTGGGGGGGSGGGGQHHHLSQTHQGGHHTHHHLPPPPPHHSPYTSNPGGHYLPPVPSPPHRGSSSASGAAAAAASASTLGAGGAGLGGGGGGAGGGQQQHHLAIDRLDIHSPGPGGNNGVDWYGQRMPPPPGPPGAQGEYSRGAMGAMGVSNVDRSLGQGQGQGVGVGGVGNGLGGVGGQGQGQEGSNGATSPAGERRKEASNVVIACRQCRARKIRCDSTRPGCNNCARRNNQCEYDAVPKRRGPDKRPGTRQRSCKKRPAPGEGGGSGSSSQGGQGTGQQPPTKRKRTNNANNANSAAAAAAGNMNVNQVDSKEGVITGAGGQGGGQGMYQYAPPPPPGGGELRLSSADGYGVVKLEHSPTYRRDLTYDPYSKSPSSTSYTRHLGLVDPTSPYTSVDGMGMRGGPVDHLGRPLGHSGIDSRGGGLGGGSVDGRGGGMGGGGGRGGMMGEMPRNISLQQMNTVIAEQLSANWGRLLKANPVPVIMQEIVFVVNGTGHYLSFINVENLERVLSSQQFMLRVHPGFVWAALALANLMRSSTYGRGQQGLGVAMALFQEAKSALDIAWADASYAYGALIIALFESSAHPHYSHARALNALVELDDYIHQMRLTMQDAHDPDVSSFDGVPIIYYPKDRETLDPHRSCGCSSLASASSSSSHSHPGHSGVSGVDLYGSAAGVGAAIGSGVSGAGGLGRTYIPPWETTWTLDQIRAEEVRRMCWSALSLVSAFLAQAATDNRRMPVFHLSDPRQYRLLFPGETTDRREQAFNYPDGLTAKESVWALYCRSMLLWNYANRFRNLEGTEDEGVSDELTEVMSEASVIEESLDMHKCGLDGMLMFTTREYTHNIRMLGTQGLRVLQGYPDRSSLRSPGSSSSAAPAPTSASGGPGGAAPPGGVYFKRKHLEDWVNHQEKIVRQVLVVCGNLGAPEGVQVTERPFRVQWFFNGLATALQLWEYDRTLDEALHLGKRFLQIVDTMNYLWDCPENRAEAAQLRSRLTEACRLTGVEPPYSPRQLSLR